MRKHQNKNLMMTLTNKCIFFCFSLLLSAQLSAQDIIQTYLTSNPVLTEKWEEISTKGNHRTPLIIDTLSTLDTTGILDDFSYPGPYPDAALWLDSFVFINRTYPYSPPTIGVATFDGLNQKGYPYDFTASENSSRIADYLTSKPINLNYPAGDSIYLSFYFQPQGRGNSPASRDSLVLEFKSPTSFTWNSIWSKTGSTLQSKDTSSWTLVMIPITNSLYLQKGFQFRFKNYATVSGSLDHWHIDYVYLNRFRKFTNTVFEDVSYVYDHPPLINTYSAMPWKQYTTAFAQPSVTTPFRNNSSTGKNVSSAYKITDGNGATFYSIPLNAKNVNPYTQTGYFSDVLSSIPAFPLLTGPATYYAQAYLTSPPDMKMKNDTLVYEQQFGNYFAYDDGSAESAFGLTKPNGQLAVKFRLNVPDSLRYVDIYFNPILTNASAFTFNLKVWVDGGNIPGSEVASSRLLYPRYANKGQNAVIRYGMDAAVGLPAGTFYVGFVQTSNNPLNVGLDMNNNSQLNTFYNVGSGWNTNPYPGAPILHPVFGRDSAVTAISENNLKNNIVELYPNPVTSDLSIRATDHGSHKMIYTIMDVYGREVVEDQLLMIPATIDVSNLSQGIYFIRVIENNITSTLKFIKLE